MQRVQLCMKKATDELRKTHRLLNKVMDGLNTNNVRLPEILKTMQRTFHAHVFLQDEILVPVLRVKLYGENPFINEVVREHGELERLLVATSEALGNAAAQESQLTTLREKFAAHIKKEDSTLYPRAELAIDPQTLAKLAEQMEQHQSDVLL